MEDWKQVGRGRSAVSTFSSLRFLLILMSEAINSLRIPAAPCPPLQVGPVWQTDTP
jgi:hypothetical protein